MRASGISRTTYVAYLALVASLGLLGAFVAALAFGSVPTAVASGVAMLICLGVAVLRFRVNGARLAAASEAAGQKLSVWGDPLRAAQIAQYRATYRSEQQCSERALAELAARDAGRAHDLPAAA